MRQQQLNAPSQGPKRKRKSAPRRRRQRTQARPTLASAPNALALKSRMASRLSTLLDNSGFLKCAFAPNDFANTGFMGIPDQTAGKVFDVNFDATFSVSLPANHKVLIIVAPSPGIAYAWISGANPTWTASTFKTVEYPSMPELMDVAAVSGDTDTPKFSDFRFVSSTFEASNTTPNLYQGGSVLIQNCPLKYAPEVEHTGDHKLGAYISGLPKDVSRNVYADTAANGFYTVLANSETAFEWFPSIRGIQTTSFSIPMGTKSFFGGVGSSGGRDRFRGFDNGFGSKLIEITAPSNAQTFVLRATSCVEFRPTPDTLLSAVAHRSPAHSPEELALYHEIAKELPIAVPRSQNGKFWNFIKRIGHVAIGALKSIPGPIGMAATGASMLTNGISTLFM